ncbi:SLAM family member 5-like [Macrotis lagotis]|uniref:SLAM family member 5-like n=1 Tax=Macrotis lagotis TaxID=92651 RepID=UPI003D69CC71
MGRPPMKVLFANKVVCFQLPRVLGALVILLGAWIFGAQSSEIQTTLHGVKGGFILFHLKINTGEEIEKITWSIEMMEIHQILFVIRFKNGCLIREHLQNTFDHRVHMPSNMTFLRIGNLTLEDSGSYSARIEYRRGLFSDQNFFLSVYEPILLKIEVLSKFLSSDWCNITLICQVLGITKTVTVSWESEDISMMKLFQENIEQISNSSILGLSLTPSFQNFSLTCLAKNPVEQKSIKLNLQDACDENFISVMPRISNRSWQGRVFLLITLLGILGIGVWFFRRKQKKEDMNSSRNQRNGDNSIQYAEVSLVRPHEVKNQCQEACEMQPQERKVLTIYSEIQKIPPNT